MTVAALRSPATAAAYIRCKSCKEPIGELVDVELVEGAGMRGPVELVDEESAQGQAIANLLSLLAAARHVEQHHDPATEAHRMGRIEGIETAIEVLRRKLDPAAVSFGSRRRGPRPAPMRKTPAKAARVTTPLLDDVADKACKSSDVGLEVDPQAFSKYERSLVEVLARQTRGISRMQLAVLSGRSQRSSTFDQALRNIRDAGLVQGSPLALRVTAIGSVVAGEQPKSKTAKEVRDGWLSVLSRYESNVLRVFIDANGPAELDEVAESTGYSLRSSTFDQAVRKLRDLALIARAGGRRSYELAPELRS